MKRDHWVRSIGILVGLAIGFYPSLAVATTYTNGVTTLVLDERQTEQDPPPSGFYFTRASGREWMGRVTITSEQGAAGSYYYEGTFTDRTMGPGPQLTCTGDILIRRAPIGRSARLGATTTWTITGGWAAVPLWDSSPASYWQNPCLNPIAKESSTPRMRIPT